MALDQERPSLGLTLGSLASDRARMIAGGLAHTAGRLGRGLASLSVVRFIGASLLRRILVANLAGLVLLIGGILYLSQHHAWLIDAKRDSLRAQGEIIAAAIAANATLSPQQELIFEPGSLPDPDETAAIPGVDAGLAELELSIRPERVARILHKLVKPMDNRARIYGRDGTLVMDSAMLAHRGRPPASEEPGSAIRTKTFWTRLHHWLIDKELPVYKEIGSSLSISQ
jgi:two-component system sensor histidine kinase ChvG